MKKLIILPALAMLLTGCGAQAPTTSVEPDFDSYLMAIRMDGGYLGQLATDAELVELGAAACDELSNGATVSSLADGLESALDTQDTRRFIASQIAASAAFLCPETV